MKKGHHRADDWLVKLGLCQTKSKAQAIIMAGAVFAKTPKDGEVFVKVEKAGEAFPEGTNFELRTEEHKYVGRGALKLKKALGHWADIVVSQKLALDIGSSTGGFTQILLEFGARQVVALDVGTHQLHEKLRQDSRVISLEQQHVLHCDEMFWKTKGIELPFDLLVTDLSFISLTKVLPHAAPWLRVGGAWIALVKPQFELEPSKVPKGIVKDPVFVQEAIDKVISCVKTVPGLEYIDIVESPIKGSEGNKEFLLCLKKVG